MRLRFTEAVREAFPALTAQLLTLEGLGVVPRDAALEAFKDGALAGLRESLRIESLKDEPRLRAYRDFYWRMGVDPTKIRPASEALLRRVLRGRDPPRINTLVDASNLASMRTHVALAAFDTETMQSDFAMRFAREGEPFLGIGMREPMTLRGKEVVVEDDLGPVAVYPYRDAERTKVTPKTRAVAIMVCGVPGIGEAALSEAATETVGLVTRFCGGRKVGG
ncbi:MAG: B3/4 domain-containing protein [Thermoplasmata archaeon]